MPLFFVDLPVAEEQAEIDGEEKRQAKLHKPELRLPYTDRDGREADLSGLIGILVGYLKNYFRPVLVMLGSGGAIWLAVYHWWLSK